MKIVLVHGGAASVTPSLLDIKLAHLRQSAKKGFLQLVGNDGNSTGATLNAVQHAVQVMEDSPYFNAGFGASLTADGTVEMDAIIADGGTLDFGAVASVTRFKNPVAVARSILEKSEHCLFAADGAHRYAKEHNIVLVDPSTLVHQFAMDRLEEYKTFSNALSCDLDDRDSEQQQQQEKKTSDHDTVGAVALNNCGMTAAATSTGGITGKQPGRVGDTPCIGSGAYADNSLGAVSTTGHGEAIMKVCLSRDVLARYEENLRRNVSEPMQKAVDDALDNMKNRVNGFGGVIAVGVKGHIGIGFTTRHLPWAYVVEHDKEDSQSRCEDAPITIHYGYERGEHHIIQE